MGFPTYDIDDLAEFSGRPAPTYPEYTEQALSQALLLFKIATCLAGPPDDPTKAELSKMAILSMADEMVLVQPNQKAAASPFNSESIGSYSYSKMAGKMAKQVTKGKETGVMWFDLAVERLSVCNTADGIPYGGGIEVFEFDGLLVDGQNGNQRLVSPKDQHLSNFLGWDPRASNEDY